MSKQPAFNHPTPFVGRANELAAITMRILNPECRLLALTGLGGCGKTRLAVEATDRFGMHELLRQYASEQLDAIGEAEATHLRHSEYFAELMREYEAALKQSQQLETMRAIERDFEN